MMHALAGSPNSVLHATYDYYDTAQETLIVVAAGSACHSLVRQSRLPQTGVGLDQQAALELLVRDENIKPVDGGTQRCSFTYADDGIDTLVKIIANKNGVASGNI